jgi:predicted regulator of Ras-like GTPase activity (Roadblock/LC7/MglB family)
MAKQPLILTEKDILEIDLNLVRLIKDSEARCALLVDQDGLMLARKGFTKEIDCEQLAVLLASSFASTRAMAKLVGESEFSVLFHQGEREHIHTTLVDDSTIMAIIFDDRTTIGMVRVYSKDIAKKIQEILDHARSTNEAEEDLSELAGGAGSRIDDMFGGMGTAGLSDSPFGEPDATDAFPNGEDTSDDLNEITAEPERDRVPTRDEDDRSSQDDIGTQIDVLGAAVRAAAEAAGEDDEQPNEDTLPMMAQEDIQAEVARRRAMEDAGSDVTLPDMPAGGAGRSPRRSSDEEYTKPTQLLDQLDND